MTFANDRLIQLRLISEYCNVKISAKKILTLEIEEYFDILFLSIKLLDSSPNVPSYLWFYGFGDNQQLLCYDIINQHVTINKTFHRFFENYNLTQEKPTFLIKKLINRHLKISQIKTIFYLQ